MMKFQLSKVHQWKTPAPAEMFISLEKESKTKDFIQNNRAGYIKTWRHYFYKNYSNKSDFDINGILDIYPLHIFNEKQLMKIFSDCELKRTNLLNKNKKENEKITLKNTDSDIDSSSSDSNSTEKNKNNKSKKNDNNENKNYNNIYNYINIEIENEMKRIKNLKIIKFKNVLDVGSGVGQVTDILKTICDKITVTETSVEMSKILIKKGYVCLNEDIAVNYNNKIIKNNSDNDSSCYNDSSSSSDNHSYDSNNNSNNSKSDRNNYIDNDDDKYDLISMLNVLDRTPQPISLLKASHKLLAKNGLILIATPLPFRPFYFSNDHINIHKNENNTNNTDTNNDSMKNTENKHKEQKIEKPLEEFNLLLDSKETWEEQAENLLVNILPEYGYKPIVFSRLPYISAGDYYQEYIALDDIIIIAQKI